MDSMDSVKLAFIIGGVPTLSMICCSFLFSSVEVSVEIEACFQNFASGLILAAVAAELFPLIFDANSTNTRIGVTCGFAIGLSLVYGIERVIACFENIQDDNENRLEAINPLGGRGLEDGNGNSTLEIEMKEKTHVKELSDPEIAADLERESISNREDRSYSSFSIDLVKISAKRDWQEGQLGISLAELAIGDPKHRGHIQEHLVEINEQVKSMDLLLGKCWSE